MERARRRMEEEAFMEYSVEKGYIEKFNNLRIGGRNERGEKQTRRSFRDKFRGECSYDEITRGEKSNVNIRPVLQLCFRSSHLAS